MSAAAWSWYVVVVVVGVLVAFLVVAAVLDRDDPFPDDEPGEVHGADLDGEDADP